VDVLDNEGDAGGGLFLAFSEPSLEHVRIEGNEAGDSVYGGGGVCLLDSSPDLHHVSIVDNSSYYLVGGLAAYNASPTLTNVAVTGNRAEAWEVGGISLVGSAAALTNVLVAGNHGLDVGGIWIEDSTPTLTSVAVVGNHGGACGGLVAADSVVQLTNVEVSHNQDWWEWCGGICCQICEIVMRNTNVGSNVPGDFLGFVPPIGELGNTQGDPGYMDTTPIDPADWDLHLSPSSPLIDGGQISILDPDGSPSDIGIYGGPDGGSWDRDQDGYPEWWQPGPYDPSAYPGLGWDCDDSDPGVFPGAGC